MRLSVDRGRTLVADGDPRAAAALLRESLAFWRGPPLAEVSYEAFARDEIGPLEELRLAVDRTKVDHDVVDQAPWIAYMNPGWNQLLADRVGNYEYHPQWGVLIDQLWVE